LNKGGLCHETTVFRVGFVRVAAGEYRACLRARLIASRRLVDYQIPSAAPYKSSCRISIKGGDTSA
jgi:hypothetical protein